MPRSFNKDITGNRVALAIRGGTGIFGVDGAPL
jgi:hypothetical protein